MRLAELVFVADWYDLGLLLNEVLAVTELEAVFRGSKSILIGVLLVPDPRLVYMELDPALIGMILATEPELTLARCRLGLVAAGEEGERDHPRDVLRLALEFRLT